MIILNKYQGAFKYYIIRFCSISVQNQCMVRPTPLRETDLFVGGLWVLYLKVMEHNNGGRVEGTQILILGGYDGLEPSFTRTSMTMVVDKFRSVQKITKPICKDIHTKIPKYQQKVSPLEVPPKLQNCPNSIHGNNYIPSLVYGHLFYSNVGAIHAGP